eukprot:11270864-Karenia_brevis.AAC.1
MMRSSFGLLMGGKVGLKLISCARRCQKSSNPWPSSNNLSIKENKCTVSGPRGMQCISNWALCAKNKCGKSLKP